MQALEDYLQAQGTTMVSVIQLDSGVSTDDDRLS
jgi:hypothetical protein